jgi:hypothetical protein
MRCQTLSILLVLTGCTAAPKKQGCREGQHPPRGASAKASALPRSAFTHSHNDYEQARPLHDALAHHVASVEVDIFFGDGTFPVSHDDLPHSQRGTLQALYLDPLWQRIEANEGHVYPDGARLRLVIDIKEEHPELAAALYALLHRYPMFTEHSDAGVGVGPVDLVLSGAPRAKAEVLERARRWASRDTNQYAAEDVAGGDRVAEYALDWGEFFWWEGEGELDEAEAESMRCIVENAAAMGRSVRFYDAPDRPSAWQAQLENGVAFINTDVLE